MEDSSRDKDGPGSGPAQGVEAKDSKSKRATKAEDTGLWIKTNKGYVSIDLEGKRVGSVAKRIRPATIDGANGSLWLGEMEGGVVWLRSYDRQGKLRKSIKTSGSAMWCCAAYNDKVAAMMRMVEDNKPKAMMAMYEADDGSEVCRHPGASSHTLMVGDGELYYGERITELGQYNVKIMYRKGDQDPVERLPGFPGDRLEIVQMPDDQVAFWLGRGQPVRGLGLKPPYSELTEKLVGQLLLTDKKGLWVCTVKPGVAGAPVVMKLYRYKADESDPTKFSKEEVKLPNTYYRSLNGAAVSRQEGILFLGQNRMKENLWIFDSDGKYKVVALGEFIEEILSFSSNESS